MNEGQMLFSLLRQGVCGEPADEAMNEQLTPELLKAVCHLARPHDLLHIVGYVLQKLQLSFDVPAYKKVCALNREAIFRYSRMILEYEQICKTLEEANIRYVPLKGSVLRDYYPEPWMRTSCDIDILVQESDLDAAADALVQNLQFTRGKKEHHDISLFSPVKVRLELHFSLEHVEHVQGEREILHNVWKHVLPEGDSKWRCRLTDEMFYFYHVTHMAKHLQEAECSIRPFLDLWIMNHRMPGDAAAREALLRKGGMLPFARAAEKLSEVWFTGDAPDAMSRRLEALILQYGTDAAKSNYVALKQNQSGGKLRFVLDKIFPSFDRMTAYYPVLKKKPWLLPIYVLRRWWRLIFTRDAQRAKEAMKLNAEISAEDIASMSGLLKHLGLGN